MDRNDIHHQSAKVFYQNAVKKEILRTSIPVIVETWLLLEARLGTFVANKFWQSMVDGIFEILEVDREILTHAFEIENKYQKAGFGIVDATCFALCEKYKIQTVFTFDRKHFSLYKPSFSGFLHLAPD